MKKRMFIIILASILCVLLLINSCAQNDDWKTIDIDEYGKVDIPKDWTYSIVDEFLVIYSDSNQNNIALVQYRSGETVNGDFDNVAELIFIQDENFSNSSAITKYEVHYKDGSVAERYMLYFTGPNNYQSTEFICLDDSISEDTLKKIAKSFVMYE